jgi:hypothetical protein
MSVGEFVWIYQLGFFVMELYVGGKCEVNECKHRTTRLAVILKYRIDRETLDEDVRCPSSNRRIAESPRSPLGTWKFRKAKSGLLHSARDRREVRGL